MKVEMTKKEKVLFDILVRDRNDYSFSGKYSIEKHKGINTRTYYIDGLKATKNIVKIIVYAFDSGVKFNKQQFRELLDVEKKK